MKIKKNNILLFFVLLLITSCKLVLSCELVRDVLEEPFKYTSRSIDTQLLLSKSLEKLIWLNKKNNIGLLRRALQSGANPNYIQKDNIQFFPLLTAVIERSSPAVDLLLKYNANPNQYHTVMGTPLMLASDNIHFSLPIIKSLLQHNAKPNLKLSLKRDTPLISIVENLLSLKHSKRSQWEKKRKKADYLEAIQLLLEHDADPHIKNDRGQSAITIAQHNNDQGLANLLSEGQPILINKLDALLSKKKRHPRQILLL